ncbi:hypothetical protein DDT52_15170 [Brenneria roseae subsp. roseae]|nr:hypothetical protein DDT52_15170 [Brenneria roseae subsp. roseae]
MPGYLKPTIILLHPYLFQLLIETIYLYLLCCRRLVFRCCFTSCPTFPSVELKRATAGKHHQVEESVIIGNRQQSKHRFTSNKLNVQFFVISFTKKLTSRISASILKNVNSVTEKTSTHEDIKMKLLNKIIAMFENINVNFGTFNN